MITCVSWSFSDLSRFQLYIEAHDLTDPSGRVFVQDNDDIRCASILLMGNLSKFGSGEQVFKDQIHNVLVSLLLHLVDPNAQVVKVQEDQKQFKLLL